MCKCPMIMLFESNFRPSEKEVYEESVPSGRTRRRGRALRSRRHLESHRPDDETPVKKPDSSTENP